VLSRLISQRGAPRYLRSDSGPEFVSRTLRQWTLEQGIESAVIDPGAPWQNGTTESFNGRLRDECLNMEWFRNRTEARIVIEDWRRHYNEVRPHSSLGYLTPQQATTYTKPATSLRIETELSTAACVRRKRRTHAAVDNSTKSENNVYQPHPTRSPTQASFQMTVV